MNKMLISILISLFLMNCTRKETVDQKAVELSSLDRSQYSMSERVEGNASSFRLWILFIPIGGKSFDRLEQKAYNRALGSYDSLLEPKYNHRKVVLPLILVNFSIKIVDVKAIGIEYKLNENSTIIP